ncbi:hypothetical protein QYM36_015020 [Artemia franciscana]|uniref:Symplekin/Pta1 N-terminal domain-containing protein n=1 Tax=Artemia franciscana TaxID=6661 RepID=A0AA88HE08_ARTSF|nr:hypothetical protein QYM36_015020 [Artemia franciscana]
MFSSVDNFIVEFLNQAVLAKTTDEKLTCLTRVQDLILHHGPELLDSFLDEVLAFQNDRNQEIRRVIVGFLEEACKSEPDVFPKVAVNISFLLRDEAVAVQKRVIQALTHLYPVVLRWLSRAKSITKEMSSAWDWLVRMKGEVIKWLDHDNDGVRTLTNKFYEMVIICQTYRDEESASKESEFSLDAIPPTLKILKPRKLEDEANKLMADLIKFHGSMHISSANLLACMGTLSLIARARPMFMGQVISAMEMLHGVQLMRDFSAFRDIKIATPASRFVPGPL